MAFAEVGSGSQRATTEFSGTTGNIAYPGNVTSGNLLIVTGAVWHANTISSLAITDSLGTSYSVLSSGFDEGSDTIVPFIAYGTAPASSTCTVTINPDNASGVCTFIDEFSGQDASPLDTDDGVTKQTGTASPSASITPTTANALLIGLLTWLSSPSATGSVTEGTSYTKIGEVETQDNQAGSGVFRIATTATAYTIDWTLSEVVGLATYIYAAAFEAATSTGAVSAMLLRLQAEGLVTGSVGVH